MTTNKSKSPLERFLGLFAEVRGGEGVTAIMLALNVFLVFSSYYIAKVVREPLILLGGGAELKSYLSAVMVFLLILAVRGYAWLASKFARRKLINVVNIFFSACMALFFIAPHDLAVQVAGFTISLGVIFFLWVGMFNVMVVAQFWSFANDIYTPEEGKRLFALVAFGASSGAAAGSYLPKQLIDVFGGDVYPLLLLAAGVLLLSLMVTNYVDARERNRVRRRVTEDNTTDEVIGKEGAFKLLFNNRYLLMIGVLVLLLNWVNTNGEYILSRTVSAAATEVSTDKSVQGAFIAKFFSDFFLMVNLAALFVQLFLVSRIIKYLGIRIAILILPVIALGGYTILALYPLLGIVFWAKTAENSMDYSLNNTVRHALFLPTSKEEKYKAKQVVDSFFHRSGDVLSAGVVWVGVNWLAFESAQFAIFNLILVAVWLVLAVRIGRDNKQLVEEKEQVEQLEAVT
ncbi:MFS transporter [bacterium]|nr:MFS transporter [bacterium]